MNTKVVVYDAMCGQGKTERIIKEIAEKSHPVLYISPLLSEVDRVCGYLFDDDGKRMKDDDGNLMYEESHPLYSKQFISPSNGWGFSKSDSIKLMLQEGRNIASTHSLFSILDEDCLKFIRDNSYELIIDEELCVWKKFQVQEYKDKEDGSDLDFLEETETKGMTKTDKEVANLIANGVIEVDPIGMLHWQEDKYKLAYDGLMQVQIKRACDAHQLFLVANKTVYWEFSVDLINAFGKVTILTYLFESSYFSKYLNYYNIKYDVERFGNSPKTIKHLVNIVEGKINDVGEKETALSFTNLYKSTDTRKVLNKNLANFYRNICKSKAEDRLWTTYKCAKAGVQGRHNVAWLAFSTKATNDYIHCRDVAYLCNNYPNVNIGLLIKTRSDDPVDKDLWALSNMIQFVFRSRLRKGEPINLYVPSRRMRELFKKWLDGEFDE